MSNAPVDIGAVWREWLGSITSRRIIEEANLWLITKRPSASPEILDQEHRDLVDDVWHLFLGMLLLGTPSYEGGYLLTGAHTRGSVELRQYQEIKKYLLFRTDKHLRIDENQLRSAGPIKGGLRAVYADDGYMRVRRGVSVFWKGLEEAAATARLHQFVRATEAVVKPAPPGIGKKMVDRCQTFTGRDPNVATIIGEAYRLRGREEHLLDWEDAIPPVLAGGKEEMLLRRMRQAEALARHIYQRVLTSAPHRGLFHDTRIDAFWQLPEYDRMTQWGLPFNINSVQ